MTLTDLIPDAQVLLALEPEELAGYILEYLNSKPTDRHDPTFNLDCRVYERTDWDRVQEALVESWMFLKREGLVAPRPNHGDQDYFITRRGRCMPKRSNYEAFRSAACFPLDSIHQELKEATYSLFMRGKYETAVFEAFKTLEIRVREMADFEDEVIGVKLMRQAFAPENGFLSHPGEPGGERVAVMELFTGAIGRFKNPSSHRRTELTDPTEAVEILQFASYLHRILDDR